MRGKQDLMAQMAPERLDEEKALWFWQHSNPGTIPLMPRITNKTAIKNLSQRERSNILTMSRLITDWTSTEKNKQREQTHNLQKKIYDLQQMRTPKDKWLKAFLNDFRWETFWVRIKNVSFESQSTTCEWFELGKTAESFSISNCTFIASFKSLAQFLPVTKWILITGGDIWLIFFYLASVSILPPPLDNKRLQGNSPTSAYPFLHIKHNFSCEYPTWEMVLWNVCLKNLCCHVIATSMGLSLSEKYRTCSNTSHLKKSKNAPQLLYSPIPLNCKTPVLCSNVLKPLYVSHPLLISSSWTCIPIT